MSEDNTQEVQTPENMVEDTSAEVSPEVETPQEDLSRQHTKAGLFLARVT